MTKRKGANYSEIARIKKMTEAGVSPEEISDILRVEVDCVRSFAGLTTKPKRSRRTKAEMEAAEAATETED